MQYKYTKFLFDDISAQEIGVVKIDTSHVNKINWSVL